jgi:MFS family permease
VYLSEIATPGHKGFYVSWQSASQQVAVMFAALVGMALAFLLPSPKLSAWGWRIPLLLGCAILPLLFALRRSLSETDEFKARQHKPSVFEVLHSLRANWNIVLIGMMMVTMTTVSFYMITVYTPTFANSVLHLAAIDGLIVTLFVGASNLFWLPVMGAFSDRVGRRPILLACTILMLVTAYPAMVWLVRSPSFSRLLVVELWLSFLFGSYNGAMVVFLTEIMPASVRTTGFALAYSLATAIFGGFTPALSTYLIHFTGNRAVPGLWLSISSACGLVGALLGKPDVDSNRSIPSQPDL